jgi:DNA helicase HerA-like ATPase
MKSNEKKEFVGIILSEATTKEATCQLFESAERGGIREGMLLVVETKGKELLCRVATIIPFNAFYTEGDAFSEPRRKGLPIPEDVARRYEVCKLDLLIEIKPKAEIKYPPQPGDKVVKLDPKLHEKDIYGVAKGDSKYVWYGSLAGYTDAPVPLNVENIPMHMAIFGVTGSGKSFDSGALIEQLSNIPRRKREFVSYPMVIIDSHGDYADYIDYWSKGIRFGRFSWIKRLVFPNAYVRPDFRKKAKFIQPIGLNLDLVPPRELAEIIILFYKGTLEGAELQVNGLDTLFDNMEADGYTSLHDVFTLYFSELLQRLANISTDEISRPTNSTINRALHEFITIERNYQLLSTKSPLKDERFIDKITAENGIIVIDFSADAAPGIDLKTKQLVMTYLASMLFERFTRFKIEGKEKYLIFMIEEAQNYCPDKSFPIGTSLAHNKLSAIATQGRKFGLSLCIISQRPSFVDRIVLSQCNSFFIHRVAPEDLSFVRSVTGGLPKSLSNRLTNLDKGEVIVTGQINTVPFPLDIRVPNMTKVLGTEDEEIRKKIDQYILEPHKLTGRKIPHTVGKTRVVENL